MRVRLGLRFRVLWIIVAAVVAPNVIHAAEPLALCVIIEAETQEQHDELFVYVMTEMGRYPAFRVVNKECDTSIVIEVFKFMDTNVLSIRAGQTVPFRSNFTSTEELQDKLKEGISLALGNDPVYLQKNIVMYSAAQRAFHSMRVQGQNAFRLELFQGIIRTGKGASSQPGVAFSVTRGSRSLFVMSRLHSFFRLTPQSRHQTWLDVAVGVDGGFTWEFFPLKMASLYLGSGVGAGFFVFKGRQEGHLDTAMSYVLQGFVRTGVRMFRYMNFDMDFFIQGYAPFFADIESPIMGEIPWTPSVQVGLGVGF